MTEYSQSWQENREEARFVARLGNGRTVKPGLFEVFSKTRALVVGDLMLDRYIGGNVTRISPEAPVPVVHVTSDRLVLGGACNVAVNVRGLGAHVFLAGALGTDIAGDGIRHLLDERGIDTTAVVCDPSRTTTQKTRVTCGGHQLVRMDEEDSRTLDRNLAHDLTNRIRGLLANNVDVIVLSDYAKGVISDDLAKSLIDDALRFGIPVLVDPKRTDFTAYSRATCITPNTTEFQSVLAHMGISPSNLSASAQLLRDRLMCPMLLITQGADGMTLVDGTGNHHRPAVAQEVYDVCGAGDTVIATFALAISAGLPAVPAMELANAAAGIVVRKAGTSPITWADLSSALNADLPTYVAASV